MGTTITTTKVTKTPRPVGDRTIQKKYDKPVDLAGVNNQKRKWTFTSKVKNFFEPARKQRKIAEWTALPAQQTRFEVSGKPGSDPKPQSVTSSVAVSVKTEKKALSSTPTPTPTGGLSRIEELNKCAQGLRESDFRGMFRYDATSPIQWIMAHRQSLEPIANDMMDRMTAMIGTRDPASFSEDELHDIAAAVWSVWIPGLHGGFQQELPEGSKQLFKEFMQACSSAPAFSNLDQTKRNDAIKAMFYFAYFNRGLQKPLCERSPRLKELEAIGPKQRSEEEKKELAREEAFNLIKFSIAQFGAMVCGLQTVGKNVRIAPTEAEMASGKAFYQKLSTDALSRAGVSRVATPPEPAPPLVIDGPFMASRQSIDSSVGRKGAPANAKMASASVPASPENRTSEAESGVEPNEESRAQARLDRAEQGGARLAELARRARRPHDAKGAKVPLARDANGVPFKHMKGDHKLSFRAIHKQISERLGTVVRTSEKAPITPNSIVVQNEFLSEHTRSGSVDGGQLASEIGSENSSSSAHTLPGDEQDSRRKIERSLSSSAEEDFRHTSRTLVGALGEEEVEFADPADEDVREKSELEKMTAATSPARYLTQADQVFAAFRRALASLEGEDRLEKVLLNDDSTKSFNALVALVGKKAFEIPASIKVVASGQLDGFARNAAELSTPGIEYKPEVSWRFALDANIVRATYSMQRASGVMGLSGAIEFAVDATEDELDCWLMAPRITHAASAPSAKSSDVDSSSDSEERVLHPEAPEALSDERLEELKRAKLEEIGKRSRRNKLVREKAYRAKEMPALAATTVKEALKSDLHKEAEARYGKGSLENQKKVTAIRRKHDIECRKIAYACIPGKIRGTLNKAAAVDFFRNLGGPLSMLHGAGMKELEAQLKETHKKRVLGAPYAAGVLAAHEAALEGDAEFGRNEASWIVNATLQSAYADACSQRSRSLTSWLQTLIDIRAIYTQKLEYEKTGNWIEQFEEDYLRQCKEAGVDHALIEDKKITFREALSYALGCQQAVIAGQGLGLFKDSKR